MTTVTTDPTSVAGAWLAKLGVATERADAAAAAALFLADGWWRDLLAFTWDLRTFHGRDAIATTFGDTLTSAGASQKGKVWDLLCLSVSMIITTTRTKNVSPC